MHKHEIDSNVWSLEMMSVSSDWRKECGQDIRTFHIDVHGSNNPPESPAHLTIGLGAMCLKAHALGAHAFQSVQHFSVSLEAALSAALENLDLLPANQFVRVVKLGENTG